MNKWYSQIGNTLLDKILAYHDHKNIMIKHFCAPVNMTGYNWVVMDVTMPNEDYFNGKVLLTNHASDGTKDFEVEYRSSNLKYSPMWWAKWFGIYHKERVTNKIVESHHGWNDMHIKGFHLAATSDGVELSSLDHDATGCEGMGLQSDAYNCGVWALMELFNRKKGFNTPIGVKTEDELNDYRLKLFNLLIHIYELHEIDND